VDIRDLLFLDVRVKKSNSPNRYLEFISTFVFTFDSISSTMTETIALFGGTGRTGSYLVTLALEQGYKVQMLARTPSKVETKHANLTVVQGGFSDKEALEKVVKGATYVISCAGGQATGKNYPKDLMLNFVQLLYPIMEAEASVKVFLYQSGGMSAAPGRPLTCTTSLTRMTLGNFLGIKAMILDNEAVSFWMAENKKHFDYIITRPGLLEDKDDDAVLYADQDNWPMSAITYKALAAFTLESVKDKTLFGTYPYVMPKK
jgi:nucleoside-diphosphate-sugar epimerase